MTDFLLTIEELKKHVKLAIYPEYKNWILFKNGTYIIFDEVTEATAIEEQGLEKMKKYGPVFAGSNAGDFITITLTNTDGWVISGHGYGMYTYVHPKEMENENTLDFVVGLYGRSKRDKDGLNPEIVCISSKGEIIDK